VILEGGESARGSLGEAPRRGACRRRRAVPRRGWRPRSCARAPARTRESRHSAPLGADAPAHMAHASGRPDRAASLRRLPAPAPDVGIGTGRVPGNSVHSRAAERSGREGERARQAAGTAAEGGREGRRKRRARAPEAPANPTARRPPRRPPCRVCTALPAPASARKERMGESHGGATV